MVSVARLMFLLTAGLAILLVLTLAIAGLWVGLEDLGLETALAGWVSVAAVSILVGGLAIGRASRYRAEHPMPPSQGFIVGRRSPLHRLAEWLWSPFRVTSG